jgi:hypothetical protein
MVSDKVISEACEILLREEIGERRFDALFR